MRDAIGIIIVILSILFANNICCADQREKLVTFTLVGKVVKVSDGDTLKMITNTGAKFNIRMSDIDTPEIYHAAGTNYSCPCNPLKERPGQIFGVEATESLRELAPIGSPVKAECYELGDYGRPVCHLFVNGVNLNLEQLKRGWAMLSRKRKWVRDPKSNSAQQTAKKNKKGVWLLAKPIHPGDWRNDCWKYKKCEGGVYR